MIKVYIESVSTVVRTVSLLGMIAGDMPIKILSAVAMIAVNIAKVIYEYRKAKKWTWNFSQSMLK